MLVTSSLICGYGRHMALKFRFKTGFYCNFGRPIRCRGQMDARTPPGAKNWGLLVFFGLLGAFCLKDKKAFKTQFWASGPGPMVHLAPDSYFTCKIT